jgi:hypothetical protein
MRRFTGSLEAATRPSRVGAVESCQTCAGTDHLICLAVKLGRLSDE